LYNSAVIIEEGGMVMKEVFRNGCNAGVAPLSGGGGALKRLPARHSALR
jgi:hypothetical protein